MKTFSIKNPWAWLIASGIKDVENRSWKTKLRGTVLIHVSQKWDANSRELSNLFTKIQWDSLCESHQRKMFSQTGMPTSAIIGQVDIVDCVKGYDSIWSVDGEYQFVLKNPILFKNPILNVKGKLSFWEFNQPIKQALPV